MVMVGLSWIEVVGVFCVGERSPAASNVVGECAVLVRISFLAALSGLWVGPRARFLASCGMGDAVNVGGPATHTHMYSHGKHQ